MKTVSVIGSTSPLGVFLVKRLIDNGSRVAASFRSADLVPCDWKEVEAITPFALDLKTTIDKTYFDSEIVVWLAHLDAGRDNETEVDINLEAFERGLNCIKPDTTRKIVFISSGGSVYGTQETLPISEHQERHPLSSYGNAKQALEDKLLEFGSSSGISTVILRPGNVYGFESPERKTKGVVGAFLRSLDSGDRFALIHRGQTVRDFVHVDDVSEAVARAIDSKFESAIWNVSTGVGHMITDVLELIIKNSNRPMPDIQFVENYPSDVLVNILSPEQFYNDTGWSARIDLETGIKRTVADWRAARHYRTLAI